MLLLRYLKKPRYALIVLSLAFVMFDIQFMLIRNLPGGDGTICEIGGSLTTANLLFVLIYSILMGMLLTSIYILGSQQVASTSLLSASGAGAIFGLLTTFCTVCTFSAISLFGLSFSLSLFTDYNLLFKVSSIGLLILGLILINRRLTSCPLRN